MKIVYDYAKSLTRQCEIACSAFGGKISQGSSERLFIEISKRLAKDFLPPIDREDIAALSFSLLEIAAAAQNYKNSDSGGMLKKQLEGLSAAVNGLINKTKTCGDEIRRLININVECSQLIGTSALNKAISDFLKVANSAYFKNL